MTANDIIQRNAKCVRDLLDAAEEIKRLRLVIAHEADCTEAADDEAMRRGHEIERLTQILRHVANDTRSWQLHDHSKELLRPFMSAPDDGPGVDHPDQGGKSYR